MLALGDSAAQGVGGGHPSLGWVGQLAALGDRTDRVVNLSVSGARVGDLVDAQLPRAEELLDLLGPPEATVIHIGGNDLFRPGNPLSFGRGLRSLGGWLGSSDTGEATVLGLIPRTALGLTAAEANWRLRRTASAAAATTADVNTHARGSVGSRVAADMFHPNERGYAAWAWGFADALGYGRSDGPPANDGRSDGPGRSTKRLEPTEPWGEPLAAVPEEALSPPESSPTR
ncbi:MAG: SGNH/GDSL hydrolase family protein [Microthrixaceae bacterium]